MAQFAEHVLVMHQEVFKVLTAGARRKHSYCVELGLFSAYFEYVVLLQSENITNLVFSKIFDVYVRLHLRLSFWMILRGLLFVGIFFTEDKGKFVRQVY